MAVQIRVKPIVPSKGVFDISRFTTLSSAYMRELARQTETDLLKPTQTWTTERPRFDVISRAEGFSTTTASDRYRYLDSGTSVRRALLSADYSPKTSPGSFRSRAGSGRSLAVSRKYAFPGIEARKWTVTTKNRLENEIFAVQFSRLVIRRTLGV